MSGISAPTLATSCAALPPEGALRLRSGKASPAALAGRGRPPLCALPLPVRPELVEGCFPRWSLRPQSGEASPAAPAGRGRLPLCALSHSVRPELVEGRLPRGPLRLRSGKASPAAPAGLGRVHAHACHLFPVRPEPVEGCPPRGPLGLRPLVMGNAHLHPCAEFKRFKAFAHAAVALIAIKKVALTIFSNIGLTAPTCGPLADLA